MLSSRRQLQDITVQSVNSLQSCFPSHPRIVQRSIQSRPDPINPTDVKPKRTGHDVLQQLHSVIRLANAHPALVEMATHSMTPEQLRKAHEGLTVLANCIGAITPAASAADSAPHAVVSGSAPRTVRATEPT
jgi:hypothetical protein